MSDTVPQTAPSDIAIVGMACRLPGAATPDEYWRRIQEGQELLTVFDREELQRAGVPESLLDDPGFIPVTSLVDAVGYFEPEFFGITPSEARLMDPQHRLVLELCWHALEDAGYDPARYSGDIGVFAGAGRHAYLRYVEPHFDERDYLDGSIHGLQADIGNYGDFLATRVSYKLGLRGPALDVQTACSTALVSVHLACQSLLMGEADMALAASANLHTPQIGGYLYEEGSICSPDGHLRPFDAKANGSVFGNGGGAVVLKRLDDAITAGDRIVAVIKGSALNNDGSAKMSFTAPSVDGQAEVVARAYRVAGVDPRDIGYVETHGTGTALGDPIEIAALTSAFDLSSKWPYCALGTVKSQIGHLGPAAGIAGLIKAALVVERGHIPPCVNFDTLNPGITLDGTPFFIPKKGQEWQGNGPRIAGVSAFGVGGTNAHAILAEAPRPAAPAPEPARRPLPLVLSARTPSALNATRQALRDHLRDHPDLPWGDVAHTLATGRHRHRHRAALTATTVAEAVAALEEPPAADQPAPDSELPVVFAFPGQGAQFVGVGRALYQCDPTYRAALDECAQILSDTVGLDVRRVLMPEPGEQPRAAALLRQALWAQPAIFATEYALARTLLAAGVRPRTMIGHSVGEYAAACLAGVFSLPDALKMVAARGRLMHHRTAPGAMMAVNLPPEQLREMLPADLDIAAINAPDQTVVAGPVEAIARFDDELAGTDLLHTVLGTSLAAHSSMMDTIVEEFRAVVETVRFSEITPAAAVTAEIASTLTGEWVVPDTMARPEYWVSHLRRPVLFAQGAATVLTRGPALVVEVGPGRALAGMFRQVDGGPDVQLVTPWVPKQPEPSTGAELVGTVWTRGGRIDWDEQLTDVTRRRVALPGYPFERSAHWIEPPSHTRTSATTGLPTLASTTAPPVSWLQEPRWEPVPLKDDDATSSRTRRILALVPHTAGPVEQSLLDDGHEVTATAHAHLDQERAEQLVERLEEGARPFDTVLYVAPQEPDDASDLPTRLDRAVTEAFWPLLTVVSALARRRRPDPVDLVVVTSLRHQLANDISLRPELALLAGPCRVLPQEYPNVRVTEIDLESVADPAAVADHVAAELRHADEPTEVAYRGGARHVVRYIPVDAAAPAAGPSWTEGATYLITGGLGGIGLALAEEAAAVPGVRLVLTHRTPLPDPAEVERLLADATTPRAVRGRLEALNRLKAAGASVTCVLADVADHDAMERVRREHGPFTAVVHTAGVPGGRLIERLDPDHVHAVLAPKVDGALVLDRAVADGHTEWTVYCSSVSSVVGGVGHADYCSANAFLDAFARWRTAAGHRTISLGYDAWTEFGMAVNEATRSLQARHHPLDHPILTSRRDVPGGAEYTGQLRQGTDWVVDEHHVAGRALLPGTGIIDLFTAAARDRLGPQPLRITGLDLARPLLVPPGEATEIMVRLDDADGGWSATLSSQRPGEPWTTHATCEIHAAPEGAGEATAGEGTQALPAPSGPPPSALFSELITFGPRWDNLRAADRTDTDELLVECALPKEFHGDVARYLVHPALLDTAAGALLGLVTDRPHLPMSYESVTVHQPVPARVRSRIVRGTAMDSDAVRFDVRVQDTDGRPVIDLDGYTLRPASAETIAEPDPTAPTASSTLAAPDPSATSGLSGGNQALVCADPGDLSTLRLIDAPRTPPRPGQVEIEVRATGLNFKEVLTATGLLEPAAAGHRYGLECAGVVTRVGDGVTHVSLGDAVMAIGESCFSDYVTVPAALTCPIPATMTFTQAASIPVAFATAYDCLANVAALRSGERILVHAVTGGVGLAAVQVAHHLGAEVFGTAGNPAKRQYAASVGVAKVMDSRSLQFERETMDAGGVDVVLNSLAGEFIPAGLRTLRDRGRFVEIGRRDILGGGSLDMGLFGTARTFAAYNPNLDSAAFAAAFAKVAQLVTDGTVTPLPVRAFKLDQLAEAFTYMSRTQHIGKIVVHRPGADEHPTGTAESVSTQHAEGITTTVGVRALHQALAHGAEHVLVTRRSLGTPGDDMVVADHVLEETAQSGRHSRPELGYGFVPPQTDTERRISAIWAAVVSIEQVGRDDRFLDLGGDSLYATQVVARVRKEFGVRVAPANILGDVPLRALADIIDEQTRGDHEGE